MYFLVSQITFSVHAIAKGFLKYALHAIAKSFSKYALHAIAKESFKIEAYLKDIFIK
jgi:hypothetical protein